MDFSFRKLSYPVTVLLPTSKKRTSSLPNVLFSTASPDAIKWGNEQSLFEQKTGTDNDLIADRNNERKQTVCNDSILSEILLANTVVSRCSTRALVDAGLPFSGFVDRKGKHVKHIDDKREVDDSNFDERKISDASLQDLDFNSKGMVKSHYMNKSSRSNCKACEKPFKVKNRPKHCRRCGDIFCLKCLQFRMKLNALAHPDPEGKFRKVCKKCFDEDALVFGCSRRLLEVFLKERQFAKYARVIKNRVESTAKSFWPDQINRKEECLRLLHGFKTELTRLGSAKSLHAFKVKLKTPDWQKSKYWQAELQSADKCRVCQGRLGVRKTSGCCRVCGLVSCKMCSFRELLLYLADVDDIDSAKLAIINVAGAPLEEPQCSLLLYICFNCKEYITQKQAVKFEWYASSTARNFLDDLQDLNSVMSSLQEELNTIQREIENEFDNTITKQELEKQNEELEKLMEQMRSCNDRWESQLKTLKTLKDKAKTKTQRIFIQNYIKAKHEFFIESRQRYRSMERKVVHLHPN